jgi:sorbitol-specific phosphotransferase system component IIBC
MNEFYRVVFWLAALISGLIGYFVVVGALFSKRLAKTQAAITSMPNRALGIGAVNFVFFSVIAFILFSVSGETDGFVQFILTLPALLITAVLVIALSFGLASVANLVGERILPEASPLKRSIWGTVFLGLACALPFVGWFLMFPYVGLVGIGGFIIGYFQRGSN